MALLFDLSSLSFFTALNAHHSLLFHLFFSLRLLLFPPSSPLLLIPSCGSASSFSLCSHPCTRPTVPLLCDPPLSVFELEHAGRVRRRLNGAGSSHHRIPWCGMLHRRYVRVVRRHVHRIALLQSARDQRLRQPAGIESAHAAEPTAALHDWLRLLRRQRLVLSHPCLQNAVNVEFFCQRRHTRLAAHSIHW